VRCWLKEKFSQIKAFVAREGPPGGFVDRLGSSFQYALSSRIPDADTIVCVIFELVKLGGKSKSLSTLRENRYTEENHMTEVQEHHACPSCGNEMEKGYLISKMGVYWDDHVPRFLAPGTLLSPNTTEVFKMHYVPSYRCRSCKIIQYGEPADFVRLVCPHCDAKYEYEIPSNLHQIVCQNCSKSFTR
jgi:hypothetical protein